MPVEVIRTIASVGCSMAGSGTLSTRTSRRPCQVTAFIAVGYPARHRGALAVSGGVRLPGELLLDRVDLAEATDVALLAGEVGAEVRADHVTGQCGPITRAPRQSTLTSSCSTHWWPVYVSWAQAARMPGNLHAATATPAPEPQTSTARSARPSRTAVAASRAVSG